MYRTPPVPWDLATYIYRGQERTVRDRLKASQVHDYVYFRYTPCLTDFTFEFIRRPTPPILSSSYWTFVELTLVSWAWWSSWMSGRWPETLSVLWASQRVGFFICVRASHVCSSHSSHCVFSPAVVEGRLALAKRCFRVCSWVFSSIGWAWLFGVWLLRCCMIFAQFSAN
jgi:hypothetical protein